MHDFFRPNLVFDKKNLLHEDAFLMKTESSKPPCGGLFLLSFFVVSLHGVVCMVSIFTLELCGREKTVDPSVWGSR